MQLLWLCRKCVFNITIQVVVVSSASSVVLEERPPWLLDMSYAAADSNSQRPPGTPFFTSVLPDRRKRAAANQPTHLKRACQNNITAPESLCCALF
jgi:hypothetical protein